MELKIESLVNQSPMKPTLASSPREKKMRESLKDVGILPLPPEFEYLRDQLDDCRKYFDLYFRKKKPVLLEGPGDSLQLGPTCLGKSHTLVLDLDETLVYGYTSENGMPIERNVVRPPGEPDATEVVVLDDVVPDLADGVRKQKYEVWFRPGMSDFLTAVSEHYEVVIFSAGLKQYVETVTYKMVDPGKLYISRVCSR